MNSIRIMIIIGLMILLICKIIVYCIEKKKPVDHVNPREQCHCDSCDDECHNLLTVRMCRNCWEKFWDEKSSSLKDCIILEDETPKHFKQIK